MNRVSFAKKALREAPDYWWGDWLDVRFYLRERLSLLRGKRVADVGCGAGLILSGAGPSNELVGIDPDAAVLKLAKSFAPNARFVRGYSRRLPAHSFDVVVLANVVETVGNREALLKEVRRLLKKRGKLFLTTPNRGHPAYAGKPGKLSFRELESLLDSSGFTYSVKGWNPFPPWPFFLPNRVLARMPGWYSLLKWLCEGGRFPRSSKYFFVEAVKR